MNDLLDVLQYAQDEEEFYEFSVIMRMAVVHAQFETIHPFRVENGKKITVRTKNWISFFIMCLLTAQ